MVCKCVFRLYNFKMSAHLLHISMFQGLSRDSMSAKGKSADTMRTNLHCYILLEAASSCQMSFRKKSKQHLLIFKHESCVAQLFWNVVALQSRGVIP